MLKKLMIIFSFFIMLAACKDECTGDSDSVSYGEVEDRVTLQLYDMQYACGECFKLYRVDKIIYSESNEDKYYLNKEITISFLNKRLEYDFHKFVCESNRYNYIFTGDFRRNSLGVGRLDVTDGKLICGN